MKCPRCGTEFEGEVKQCFTCGWDFAENPADFNPRTSKLAIVSLFLGILCLFTLYLPLLAAVVIGTLAIRKIRKSRGKLTGERLAMTGVLIPILSLPILLTVGYAVWSKDAGPVPNEFTEADFKQVKPGNEVTYSILCQLNDESDDPNGAPAIGLSEEEVILLEDLFDKIYDVNEPHSAFELVRRQVDDIDDLWNQSSKGRAIIESLNSYDEIADFTVPDLDFTIPYAYDLKLLSRVYTLHALFLFETGNDIEACRQLITFDLLLRKFAPFNRSLISKLVCYALFSLDFKTTNLMLNHPDISDEAVLLLQTHFNILNDQQVSLENCIIHEYLMFKDAMTDIFGIISHHSYYKHNSVCRYYDSICRNFILRDQDKALYDYSPISVWPWESPVFPKVSLNLEQAVEKNFTLYFLYNPVGKMQMMILLPAIEKVFEIKEKVLIFEDLLQWVIAKRLGQEGSLKARAYSDEYTVDIEKGLIFSVGPDGEAYTDDDIKLRINPEVLGLK